MSSAPKTRAGDSHYHHGDLYHALVVAAGGLLGERGVEGVTLREAAGRAGVSVAAPYRHFADKNALLVAVAMAGYEALQQQVRAAPRSRGTLASLHALALSYAQFARDQPALYQLMMGSGIADRNRYAELTQAHDDTCAILIDAVAAAQARGNLNGTDAVGVAMTLWCLIHGLATLAADGRIDPADVETEARRSLRIVGAGLRPRARRQKE